MWHVGRTQARRPSCSSRCRVEPAHLGHARVAIALRLRIAAIQLEDPLDDLGLAVAQLVEQPMRDAPLLNRAHLGGVGGGGDGGGGLGNGTVRGTEESERREQRLPRWGHAQTRE